MNAVRLLRRLLRCPVYGSWQCVPCGIHVSRRFATAEQAERWCRESQLAHVRPGGVHVRVSQVRL